MYFLALGYHSQYTDLLQAGQSRVRIPAEARFSILQNVHTCSGAHPAFYSMGTGVICLVNVARAQSCHSPLSSIEVKNYWRYTSFSPVCFHEWRGKILHYVYKKPPLPVTNHIFPRMYVDKCYVVYTVRCDTIITIQNQPNAHLL